VPQPTFTESAWDDDPGYEVVFEEPWNGDGSGTFLGLNRQEQLTWWVRGFLLLIAAGLLAVFAIALALKPYHHDGSPRIMATHTQLGLPPCNMVLMLGKPCPACGMTTSVSLLAHGDIRASLRANWVGTLLALYWLVLIPWAIVSALRGKLFGVRNGEWLLSLSVGTILTLMLLRWLWIMLTY